MDDDDFAKNSSGDENKSESESEEENDENTTIGFFLGADDKPVKMKTKSKKVVAKKVGGKDNRDGQRERQRHAKAVYGKHAQGKLFREAIEP